MIGIWEHKGNTDFTFSHLYLWSDFRQCNGLLDDFIIIRISSTVNRMGENSHQCTKSYFWYILEFSFPKCQDETQINDKESIFKEVIDNERSKW